MRGFLYAFCVVSVIALAFWAYRENHVTQQSMAEVRSLNREIASLQQALSVQRAEWAYLSRPERLQQLVDLNFDRLPLLPMMGDQFGSVEEVVYPEVTIPDLTIGSVDVFGAIEMLIASGVDATEGTSAPAAPAFQGLRPPDSTGSDAQMSGNSDAMADPDPYISPLVETDADTNAPAPSQTQEQFP